MYDFLIHFLRKLLKCPVISYCSYESFFYYYQFVVFLTNIDLFFSLSISRLGDCWKVQLHLLQPLPPESIKCSVSGQPSVHNRHALAHACTYVQGLQCYSCTLRFNVSMISMTQDRFFLWSLKTSEAHTHHSFGILVAWSTHLLWQLCLLELAPWSEVMQ